MSTLREFRFKQGFTGTMHFKFIDEDEVVVSLSGSEEVNFGIKVAMVDSVILVSISETDPELVVDGPTDEVRITFNSTHLGNLAPGTYVADFWIKTSPIIVSDTFIFIVEPIVALPV